MYVKEVRMNTIIYGIIIFVSFSLGALFEYLYVTHKIQFGGVLDIDDQTDPNKIKWNFLLDHKFSPEEFSKKHYVIFKVYKNGEKQ